MPPEKPVPTEHYGVKQQRRNNSSEDLCLEQLEREGFACLDSDLEPADLPFVPDLAARFGRSLNTEHRVWRGKAAVNRRTIHRARPLAQTAILVSRTGV